MNINKQIRYWMVSSTLALMMAACTPQTSPATAPSSIMPFKVEYEGMWSCGDGLRVSFKVYNEGEINIESVFYSVTADAGFINYGTINNAPFEATTEESEPDCARPIGHGASSLAPGNGMTVPIVLNPIPEGATDGLLYIEVCSEDNRGGLCENQTLHFDLTH
jgi:hypothetical protein